MQKNQQYEKTAKSTNKNTKEVEDVQNGIKKHLTCEKLELADSSACKQYIIKKHELT
jgi:hypothetical protein